MSQSRDRQIPKRPRPLLASEPQRLIIPAMKELLRKLIQARSTPDTGELAAAQVLADYFRSAGVEAAVDAWGENRANVTARLKGTGDKPPIVLACHLDVVAPGNEPWEHPPFSGVEVGGCIHGRGSVDMKGGTAAAAAAMVRIARMQPTPAGDVIFAATAGEETDSAGATRFVEAFRRCAPVAGVIIPEPTDFDIVVAHRGLFWLEITTLGKAAHSSTPHLGVNALLAMKGLLDDLEGLHIPFTPHPLLGNCSMSINTMHAGQAMNIVPDKCTLGIDIRTVPGQDHQAIQADMQTLIDKRRTADPAFAAAIKVLRSVGPMETDPDCDFVRTFRRAVGIDATRAVGFTTDGPHFAALGGPVLIFGPGRSDQCHKPNEHIALADVERAADLYVAAIGRCMCIKDCARP